MRDDDVRSSCFASLSLLCATYGEDVPYRGALEKGFSFRGHKVPFLTPYKGIYRARAQRGPAALSINTSARSPYDDEITDDGFLYAYRSGAAGEADNRALREAFALQAPLVYFLATRRGWYKPIYPVFVVEDYPEARRVLLSPGRMIGPLDERDPILVADPIERRYVVRETRVRMHQARFRGGILLAYRERCAICNLREPRLLDAAHIAGDLEVQGEPIVANGLSLCSIHHRAFDQDLVGVSPTYEVHVSSRLLDEEDGPMLDVLKAFHQHAISVPTRRAWRPDPLRLAARFERFQTAA